MIDPRICHQFGDMSLHLYHGRPQDHSNPTDFDGNDIDDWGFSGPIISGITGFVVTYMYQVRVRFSSPQAAACAHVLTGWEFDGHPQHLLTRIHNDVLRANGRDYGDWSLASDLSRPISTDEQAFHCFWGVARFFRSFRGFDQYPDVTYHGVVSALRSNLDGWRPGLYGDPVLAVNNLLGHYDLSSPGWRYPAGEGPNGPEDLFFNLPQFELGAGCLPPGSKAQSVQTFVEPEVRTPRRREFTVRIPLGDPR